MTERATLEALLARVLEGTEPDRELDGDLAKALGGKPLFYRDRYIRWWPPSAVTDARKRKRSIRHYPTQPLPMFTQSLDAAVTLVPPGAAWVRRTPSTMALVFGGDDFRMAEVHIEPCRALIASCLEARMEKLGG